MSDLCVRRMEMPFGELLITAPADDWTLAPVIAPSPAERRMSSQRFDFRVGVPWPPTPGAAVAYRARMAARGIYLGHNLGPPALVRAGPEIFEGFIPDGRTADYQQLFWSCGIKVMCALVALDAQSLHVKATTLVDGTGRVLLLVGRGQGGKTTLATFLAGRAGYQQGGNTHAFIRDGHAWSLSTWVRRRGSGGDAYVPAAIPAHPIDGPLRGILVVEKNDEGRMVAKRLDALEWVNYFRHFVCGTGTYDLKEDVTDALGGGAQRARIWLEQEDHLLAVLLSQAAVGYLSVDAAGQRADAIPALIDGALGR